MTDDDTRRVVERLWQAINARDWAAVAALLDPAFVCEWPQSRERIRSRDAFVAVNRDYPGDWRIAVRRVVAEGERAASEVAVAIDGRVDVAVSFYELRGGRILREVDYWPEPYPAPAWRAHLVEPMEGGSG